MVQYNPSPIDPLAIDDDTTSGDELTDLLADVFAAIFSCHSGASRPTYAAAGMLWLNTSGTPWTFYLYDGSDDIAWATFNATTNVFNVLSPEATGSVAGLMSAADKAKLDAIYTATATLTNKRITRRVASITSSATPTPDSDACDQFNVTALAANAVFAAPTGTPTDAQTLLMRIKDNGSARTLGFNGAYRASSDLALPTTTIAGKTMYLFFERNAADSKWDFLSVLGNF